MGRISAYFFQLKQHSSTGNSASLTQERTAWRNAFILMRIPYSLYLMPIFWFALSNSSEINMSTAFLVFITLHVFMFPASYGFNSIYDKDQKSIGGIQNPPPVGSELFQLVMLFDLGAVLCGFLVSVPFALMVLTYILMSKAYSYDRIRLKKFPLLSTLVVAAFQGSFIYYSVLIALKQNVDNLQFAYGIVTMLLVAGLYPLLQVYQHQEDEERGDLTLSLWLGKKGTFIFSALMFIVGFGLLFTLYAKYDSFEKIIVTALCILPMVYYFITWTYMCFKDDDHINYRNVMRMVSLWSSGLSLAFILHTLYSHYFI